MRLHLGLLEGPACAHAATFVPPGAECPSVPLRAWVSDCAGALPWARGSALWPVLWASAAPAGGGGTPAPHAGALVPHLWHSPCRCSPLCRCSCGTHCRPGSSLCPRRGRRSRGHSLERQKAAVSSGVWPGPPLCSCPYTLGHWVFLMWLRLRVEGGGAITESALGGGGGRGDTLGGGRAGFARGPSEGPGRCRLLTLNQATLPPPLRCPGRQWL